MDDDRTQDLSRTCRDCEELFVISKSEQDFFASRLLSLPARCYRCRVARRRARVYIDDSGTGNERGM